MTNLYLSYKFLFKNIIQTLITIVVVTVGTAIFYFVFNASSSLKNLVLSTTADANSHIFISGSFDFNSYEDEEIIHFRNSLFEKDKQITDISYSLLLNGYVFNEENAPHPLILKGIDYDYGGGIQSIEARIVFEELNKIPENGPFDGYYGEAVIGNKLAFELGFEELEDVYDEIIEFNYHGNIYPLKIVAVFPSDQLDLSLRTIYTTIETTQIINDNIKKANAIEIKVKKPLRSDVTLTNITDLILNYNSEASIAEWQEGNKYAVNALYIEDISILIIQIFTALAIAIGINGLLLFNIREKMNQIGILKAMGSTNKDIMIIFFYQTIIVVLIGIIAGLFIGDILSILFMAIFRRPTSNAPIVTLSKNIFNMYSVISFSVIFSSSLLFSFVPIKYAQKLKIIEVIKNE